MYKTYFSRCRENIVQTEACQLLPNNVIIIISILLRKQQNQKINTSYTNCRLDILKSLFFLLMKPQLFHLNPSQNNLFFNLKNIIKNTVRQVNSSQLQKTEDYLLSFGICLVSLCSCTLSFFCLFTCIGSYLNPSHCIQNQIKH